MRCEATVCANTARWLVNSRYWEAQSAVCGTHLSAYVAELAAFNDTRYRRRVSDHGVMIYPVRKAS